MTMFRTYTVRSGDTLGQIAIAHATSIEALVALNDIKNANAIKVGQELRVRQVSEAFHIVSSGETLGKIAKRYGVSVAQIVAANSLPNANKIAVGQKLVIPSAGGTDTASSISPAKDLGSLSSKYEVGNRGPGTVSGGHGDPGGVSYGSYQFASKQGNARKFLKADGKQWEAEFGSHKQGTKPFSDVWRKIAKREPDAFHAAQHAYVKRQYFDRQVRKIESICGVDITKCSRALQDAAWSTAVQHGATTSLIGDVLKKLKTGRRDPDYDRQALIAIYGERGRTDANGTLVRFRSASKDVQRGVARRFRNELKDALDMLKAEQTLEVITPEKDASMEDSRKLLQKAQRSLTDEDVHLLIEKYGDLEAKNEFLNGEKVLIALRNPTDAKKYLRGRYDDPIIVVWRRSDGSVRLKRFMGNTEPARIYAWGQAKASKGSSTDLDGDGRNDLGRLQPGTYHYQPRKPSKFLGNKAFRARDVQVALRDTNHDGKFSEVDDKIDLSGAGRSMLLHQGGTGNNTWSAGCQTISKTYYNRFLSTLGRQTSFSYILINVG